MKISFKLAFKFKQIEKIYVKNCKVRLTTIYYATKGARHTFCEDIIRLMQKFPVFPIFLYLKINILLLILNFNF